MRPWGLLLVSACGRIGFQAGDPDLSGLIARWSFEDTTPGKCVDSISGFVGTCTDCPTQVAGHHGHGFHFDGTSCIDVPDDGTFQLATFTLAGWASQDANELQTFIAKPFQVTDYDSWEVEARSDVERSLAFVTYDGTESKLLSPADTVVLATWYHFAASWDGMFERLYYNGVEVGTLAESPVQYSADDLAIGCDISSGAAVQHLVGTLDELEVYDRALTADEIAKLATR